jgi:hypothetical protein
MDLLISLAWTGLLIAAIAVIALGTTGTLMK